MGGENVLDKFKYWPNILRWSCIFRQLK
jgi:hypothetical protein